MHLGKPGWILWILMFQQKTRLITNNIIARPMARLISCMTFFPLATVRLHQEFRQCHEIFVGISRMASALQKSSKKSDGPSVGRRRYSLLLWLRDRYSAPISWPPNAKRSIHIFTDSMYCQSVLCNSFIPKKNFTLIEEIKEYCQLFG